MWQAAKMSTARTLGRNDLSLNPYMYAYCVGQGVIYVYPNSVSQVFFLKNKHNKRSIIYEKGDSSKYYTLVYMIS